MIRLEYDILIEENPKVVWAFLANLSISLSCHRRSCRFHWIGDLKPGLGSRYALEQSLSGFTWRQEGRVTRWEPPHHMVLAQWNLRYSRRGFTHQQRLSVHPVEGQPQHAILRSCVVGSVSPKPVEVMYKQIVRRRLLSHLVALKRAIEATEKSGRTRRESARQLAEMPAVGTG